MRHLIIVTGKGGVGKSFTAALVAKKLSLEGKKVLLVDMVPESYLASSLGIEPVANSVLPQTTSFGFDWALWLGETCLAEYVQYWIRIPWMSRAFLKNSWLKSLIHLAPGLREIAFLGKLTSQVRRHGPTMDYDHIVVDAVSTGHFLSLIKTPQALAETVSSGPMHEQSKRIQDVLNDPQQTTTLIVTNLERYSMAESQELSGQLKETLQSSFCYVANKIFPIPSDLEKSDETMTESQKTFLSAQDEIKKYQTEALEQLRKKGLRYYHVPFYFLSLAETLEKTDEIRKLFKET